MECLNTILILVYWPIFVIYLTFRGMFTLSSQNNSLVTKGDGELSRNKIGW